MKNEIKRTFGYIALDKLTSGLAYQRQIKADFVDDKIKNFDLLAVKPICVSFRDGNYNVVDGQHTIAILKGVGYKKAYCEIRTGLTFEDENKWFKDEETNGRKQSQTAILNARYFSGQDDELTDLVAYLSIVGYKLNLSNVSDTNGVIYATKAIEKIFNGMTRSDFSKYITLHNAAWNGDKKSLQEHILKGFSLFYNTYKDILDEQRFIKVFNKTINKKAKSTEDLKNESDRDMDTKDVALRMAKVLVRNYNSNLSQNKKLKMSWLED